MDRDNIMAIAGGMGLGMVEENEGKMVVIEGDWTWDGEHTVQCTVF